MSNEKTPGEKLEAMNKRNDGLMNVYTREGVSGYDKQLGYSYVSDASLKQAELRTIYRSDGFAKKVVDRPVEDMLRAWINIKGDAEGDVLRYLNKLDVKQNVKRALTWAQVYGGGLIVLVAKDGGELEEPLNGDRLEELVDLQVYDRFRITWTNADLYSDPNEANYGKPEFYTVSPINGSSFRVHESRTIRFDGVLTDDETLLQNNGWSDSVYQAIRTHLVNLSGSYHAVKSILDDFVQIIINVEGLQNMIASGQENLVKERLNIIDQGRHIMNTILLDSTEQFKKEASTVTGLEKILQEFQLAVSAVVDLPLTVFMGRSPSGMNSTGESDIRNYYDGIASRQEQELLKPLSRIVDLVLRSKKGPTKGKELKDWSVEFKPLWEPTEKEVVETRKTQAETDNIYLSNGVVTPEEVATSRFAGGYSIETEIDENAKREVMGPPETTEEPDDDNV